jgi:hypothetical protein
MRLLSLLLKESNKNLKLENIRRIDNAVKQQNENLEQ